jgi:hypothetical protein
MVLFGLWSYLASASIIPQGAGKNTENTQSPESLQADFPVVKLPHATHKASTYDPIRDVSIPGHGTQPSLDTRLRCVDLCFPKHSLCRSPGSQLEIRETSSAKSNG